MQRVHRWPRALTYVRYIVTTGLLISLILMADPAKILEEWRSVDLGLLGLALALQIGGVAVSSAKWSVLLQSRGQQQPYPWLVSAYLVGQFANNFLPTGVGGDAVRAIQLGRRIGSLSQASASVFIDRLTGFLALSLIANGALVLACTGVAGGRIETDGWLYLVTIGFTLAGVAVAAGCLLAPWFSRRMGARLPEVLRTPIERVAQSLADYFPQGRALVLVLGISLLFQTTWVVINIVCGLALNIQAPLLLYALMAPLTDILGLLPVFVNNMGARELIFTLYLSQVGVSPATALALAFLVLSVRLIVSVLGGLVMLVGGADFQIGRKSQSPPPDPQPDPLSRES
ncbi:MAG: flippase-like domain-containing protein [Chloroflexaceae bacterium]|nr:flippase-like domain-containing protein [Chloroflexaceae bacterium]